MVQGESGRENTDGIGLEGGGVAERLEVLVVAGVVVVVMEVVVGAQAKGR